MVSTATVTPNSSTSSPMEDPLSPYFLHHGENPGATLVSQPLVGPYYPTRARSMKIALNAKNKLGFVDGTIRASMANSPALKQARFRCNNMVSSWIMKCVSPQITASVIYRSSAFEVRNVL